MTFSPHGRYLAVGSADRSTRVIEIATGRELFKSVQLWPVTAAAFSLNGRYVALGTKGGDLIQASEQKQMFAAFYKDNPQIKSESERAQLDNFGTGLILEAASGKVVSRFFQMYSVWTVAFSPTGQFVATGGHEGTVRIYSSHTGQIVWEYDCKAPSPSGEAQVPVHTVAFSPDERYLAINAGNDVWVFEWRSGKGWRSTEGDGVGDLDS